MSRTKKDRSWDLRSLDAPAHMRRIVHDGCELDTSWRAYRTHSEVVECEPIVMNVTFTAMIDSKGVEFEARNVPERVDITYSDPESILTRWWWRYTIYYDRREHPYARVVTRDVSRQNADGTWEQVTEPVTRVESVEVATFRFERHSTRVEPFACDAGSGPNSRCKVSMKPKRYWSPKREDRRECYYGPERADVRVALRDAIAEYNTYGDTDTEPAPRQHHHAMWGGGYWD